MLTLSQLLTLQEIQPCAVLSGGEVSASVGIRYVSVIEMPVEDFIRPGELVLSTAIGCLGSTERFLSFVRDIHASGAAALLLSIKDADYAVPSAVIDYASAVGFPVVRIPWEARFAEIIEAVLAKIRREDSFRTGHYQELQKKLLTAFINGEALSRAASIIAHFLQCQCTILDTGDAPLAMAQPPHGGARPALAPSASIEVEIQASDRTYGSLRLSSGLEDIDPERHFIRQYVSIPLMLWFDKENTINRTRLQMKDDFIWRLARGDYESQAEMHSDARLLGFKLSQPFACVVGAVRPGSGDASWLDYNIDPIKEEIIALARAERLYTLVTSQGDNIIIFIESTGQAPEKHVHSFLDSVEQRIHTAFAGTGFVWGISEIGGAEPHFHQLYANASLALTLCLNSKARYNRSTFEDTSIYKILSVLAENAEITQLSRTVLSRLIDHDRDRDMLLDTVKNYVKNEKNVSLTAREMHLHRQSLLYRLKKIEELTGLNLNRHNDLFLLEICTRLYLDYST